MEDAFFGLVATMLIVVVGWAINTHTKVATFMAEHEGLKELLHSKFDALEGRLERIERSMNGYLRHGD